MKSRLSTFGAVVLRSLPFIFGAVGASIHPAFAAVGGGGGPLVGMTTGATQTEVAFLSVASLAAITGIGLGGLHFLHDRSDMFGAGVRVMAGIGSGVVIAAAPQLGTMYGGGAIL